jgi:hypothetical protein
MQLSIFVAEALVKVHDLLGMGKAVLKSESPSENYPWGLNKEESSP